MSRSASSRGTAGLPFQDITSKLGSEELVKRLKACSKFLTETEDLDGSITRRLSALSAVLVEPFIHHHKTRDVRLLSAVCMAELFRLFYPDPPYDEDQLKVVFSVFVTQLQGLEKPNAPSFRLSFQLLECLATTKVFNLCASLDCQELLADLFKMLFAIVNDNQSSKVKMYMLDIMSSVFQDGESLSQEIIDSVLINFIEPTKSNSKAAYNFAADFVRKTSQYLEPYIQMFFNNALLVGKSAESEVVDHVYDLILELHAIDSSILLSVMPQLEFKLKSTDTEERLEVTRLLARMFSPRESRLSTENKSLWIAFLSRFADVSATVRAEIIRYSKYFLVYHPHLAQEVAQLLHKRFLDKDDKVRMECVKAVSEAAADSPRAVPQSLMEAIQERMRDKNWNIRKEAITNLGRLYRQIMSSSTSSEAGISKLDADRMAWIPNKIIHSYYLFGKDDRLSVERCLLSCLIPVSLSSEDRMQRLSHIFSRLDDNATRAFKQLLRTREMLRSLFADLIEAYEEKREERKKEMTMRCIIQLARELPDPVKCQAHLRELASLLKDEKLREQLLESLQLNTSCDLVTKSKGTALSKIGSKHGILDTVKTLLDRCCPMLIDSKCIEVLVEECVGQLCEPSLSQSMAEEKREAERAKKTVHLLTTLAELTPSQFTNSDIFESLISLLRHEDSQIVGDTLQILTFTGPNIDQTIAGCLQPILTKLAQSGPPELARHTIRCVAAVYSEPTPILHRIFKSLVSAMDYDHPHLLTTLSSMEELAETFPAIFQTSHKKIIKEFVVKKLLVVDRAQLEYREGDPEWCTDEVISHEAQSKVHGLRLLISWLVGLEKDFEHFANPVLRLLDMVLAHDGDLQGDDNISAHDRSRLRLAASTGLLKLAQINHYHELISQSQFQRLALCIQDTCDEVRDGFTADLHQGLRTLKLPLSYLSVFALAGVEPRLEVRAKLRENLTYNVARRREYVKQHSRAIQKVSVILPEYAVSHAVYLIAHHPQFSRTKPHSLDTFRDCLWFFLEPLTKGNDNYSFLRKMLETIKQTVDARDPDTPEASKNIYAVCDLTLGVLTTKLTNIKLGEFPGKVLLPTKLFKVRDKDAPANTACYLPPDYNCTPTKRLRGEANPSVSVEMDVTPKKGRKGTNRSSRTPSKTPSKAGKTPPTKKAGKKEKTQPSPQRKTRGGGGGGVGQRGGRRGRRRVDEKENDAEEEKKEEEEQEEEEDTTCDVEMQEGEEMEREEEEGEDGRETAGGRKRQAVDGEVTRKRARRRILQNSEEDNSSHQQSIQESGERKEDEEKEDEEEEEESEEVNNGTDDTTSEPTDTLEPPSNGHQRRGGGVRRGRRRRRREEEEEEEEETDRTDPSSDIKTDVPEGSAVATKKTKTSEGQPAANSTSAKTAPVKRKTRRKR